MELPPHTRRIQLGAASGGFYPGTTSAHAENTAGIFRCLERGWNYLRVRGEYNWAQNIAALATELPPRARRILQPLPLFRQLFGTTSACAENTRGRNPGQRRLRNYLRVRGEYLPVQSGDIECGELPPRARRIPHFTTILPAYHGTTSACAENTSSCRGGGKIRGNYLRVRGEYPHSYTSNKSSSELPPRARRIR